MNNFLLFLNISGGEILLIIVVIYLVFGPKKIPEFARMLGKGINEMRRATSDIRNEITREANKIKSDIGIDLDDPLKTEKKANPPSNNNTEPSNQKKEEEKKTTEKPPENKTDRSDLI
jgi:TatA/E family protein of Tat protein translocase